MLLYGCSVAEGSEGASFVHALAEATGADNAASTNPTANAALGGDWSLEMASGSIESTGFASPMALGAYSGLLADDYSADTSTTGTVSVGGSSTGVIEPYNDVDWFKVSLNADGTYQIDLEGSLTSQGTLTDPYFRGVYDNAGVRIPGTTNDDSGGSANSRLTFTPSATGTYYLSAGAYSMLVGTYKLSVALVSGPGNDHLIGTAGSEVLNGHGGNDTIEGLAGGDTLIGGAGNDTLDGGDGAAPDTADYGTAACGVMVSLASTLAQNTGGAGIDTLISIENLNGSAFDDTLTGNGTVNWIRGGDGNDTLSGLGDYDFLMGGNGNDVLNGGDGYDVVSYAGAARAVTVNLCAPRAGAGAVRGLLQRARRHALLEILEGVETAGPSGDRLPDRVRH